MTDIERARELLEENAALKDRIATLEACKLLAETFGVRGLDNSDAVRIQFTVDKLEYLHARSRKCVADRVAEYLFWKLDEAFGIHEQERKRKEREMADRAMLDAISKGPI